MNTTSEIRDAKMRVTNALHHIDGIGEGYSYEKMENQDVIDTLHALHRLLILAWRDLDGLLQEMDGIDRPL